MNLKKEIEFFLWLKIYPVFPFRLFFYLLRNRRSVYIKKFAPISDKKDKKLMLKYLLKYGLSYEEFYWFDAKNNDPSLYVTECKRWKYFKKLNSLKGCKVYTSKGETYKLFADLYGRELVTVDTKDDYDKFLEKHDTVVYKDMVNCCGKGVKLYHVDGYNKDILWKKLKGNVPFVLEEPILQGRELKVLHPESVNTIRIVTILVGNSPEEWNVVHYSPFLKTGRGKSFVDNAGSGGIFCGLSLDGTVVTDGVDEFTNTYFEHPDSHIVFKGYQLPKFEEALEITRKAALRYPENRYVGWDLAYNEDEKWVIVEGNCFAQLISQMCNKMGVKKEFEEIAK